MRFQARRRDVDGNQRDPKPDHRGIRTGRVYRRGVCRARPARAAGVRGTQFGGALMTTTEVENYPGFRDAIMGPDLMEQMRAQAERFGAELRSEDVESVELTGPVKYVTANGVRYAARSVVLSMGAAA